MPAIFPAEHVAQARAHARVYQTADGEYRLTGRDDILAALRDPERFAQRLAIVPWLPSARQAIPGAVGRTIDKSIHDAIVRLLNKPSVAAMLPTMRERAGQIIDAVAADGHCDGIADVALPFVVLTFCVIFGLGPGDGALDIATLEWSLDSELVTRRRRDPGEDLISRAMQEMPYLTDNEVFGFIHFTWGAYLNILVPIGHGLYDLTQQPRLRERVRRNRNGKDRRAFVEEVLRLYTSGKGSPRVTTTSVTVAGVTFPEGACFGLDSSYLNCDGADEMSSDEIRLDGPHRHYSLGAGPLSCPAQLVVRTLLLLFFEEWLTRIPNFGVPLSFEPRMWRPEASPISAQPALELCLRRLPLQWRRQS
jgi:cytochrome P450